MLIFCPQGLQDYPNIYQCGYLLGSFDQARRIFRHQGFQELDLGFEYYAAKSTLGKAEERIVIAWFGLPDMSCPTAVDGWAHCLSLPRVLSIEGEKLYQRPLPALAQLRKGSAHDGVHYELLRSNPDNAPFSLRLRMGEYEDKNDAAL